MEKYDVIIDPIAERDLFDIFYYISESLKEPKIAEKIYFAIKKKVLSLDLQPYMYSVVSEEPYSLKGIRKIPVENYTAFYYVDESNKTVHIIRILYNRRQWENLL